MCDVDKELVEIGNLRREMNEKINELSKNGGLSVENFVVLASCFEGAKMTKIKYGVMCLNAVGMMPYYFFARVLVDVEYYLFLTVSVHTVDIGDDQSNDIAAFRYRIRVLGCSGAVVVLDRLFAEFNDVCGMIRSFKPAIIEEDKDEFKDANIMPLLTSDSIAIFDDISSLRFGVLMAPLELIDSVQMRDVYTAHFRDRISSLLIKRDAESRSYMFSGVTGDVSIKHSVASFDGILAEITTYVRSRGKWVPPASVIWRDTRWSGIMQAMSRDVLDQILKDMHDASGRIEQILDGDADYN